MHAMKPNIYQPSLEITNSVMCYWTLEGEANTIPVKNTIVPDGTMKLIFHYDDTYKHHAPTGEIITLPKCFLIGQLTKPYVVEPTGSTGTFVARFHPNGFAPLANIPLKELENKAVSLEQLFGRAGKEIGERMLTAHSTTERIAHIESFLRERLANKSINDPIVSSTVDTIVQTQGQLLVYDHLTRFNVNHRQLNRKFGAIIGLSPKQLSRTVRIQGALKTMLTKDFHKLTDLAYDYEYFDQSHFIKEFKAFTGITPKEFYGDHLKMSLIFETVD